MLVSVFILVFLLPELSVANVEYICNNATVPGDLQITLLANQHFGASCDKSSPTTVLNPLSANIIEWSRKVLPDSTNISLRIIDSCGNAETVTKAITELIPWSSISSTQAVCTVDSGNTSIGVITTVEPINYDITNLLSEADIPLIVTQDGLYGEVSPDQTSTFSLGHSMDITLKMMSEFMVALKWDFVTVVYSDDIIGRESLKAFERITPIYYLCIDKAVAVDSSLNLPEINTNGVLYLGSQSIGLGLLTQNDLKSKIWVTSLDVKGLDLGTNGKVYSVIRSDGDPIIDSLALLGKAINSAYTMSGCSADNVEQCVDQVFKERVVNNTRELVRSNRTYNIAADGTVTELASPDGIMFHAFLYSSAETKQVANVSLSNGVTPLEGFQEDSSLCDPRERSCESMCGHLNKDYIYIHGDWIVLVAVQVHSGIDSADKWKCKEFTKTSLFSAEMARYAFTYLRQNYDSEPGKTMGMLVIDSCGNKLKTAGLVYDIVRGYKDRDFCDRKNNCFNHQAIVAAIGDFNSGVTQKIQTVLKDLPILHVSYGASTVILSDRVTYPYFLRTNPPDNVQAHFMVRLLQKIDERLDSRVNAVNLIYSDGLYGRTAIEMVKESLEGTGICVHLEIRVNETKANNFSRAVDTFLHEKNKGVKFIIAFLDTDHLIGLMDVIISEKYKGTWLSKGFSFILSDTWNDNNEYLTRYGSIVQGSFTFEFNADFQSKSFNKTLKGRRLSSVEDVNPWLSTLEQDVSECKLRGNFIGRFSNLCSSAADLSFLTGESYSLHLMKALTAVFLGVRRMAQDTAAVSYLFNPETIDKRYETLMDISIPKVLEDKIEVESIKPFTEKTSGSNTYGNETYGNGRVGYTIHNINDKQEHVVILQTSHDPKEDLGEFKTSIQFQLDGGFKDNIFSVLEGCPLKTTGGSSSDSSIDNYLIGLIVIGCVVGILAIVFIAFLITRWYKKRQRGHPSVIGSNMSNGGAPGGKDSGFYVEVTSYPELISSEQAGGVRRYLSESNQESSLDRHHRIGHEEQTYNVPRNPVPVGAYNPAFSLGTMTPDSASQVSGSGSTNTSKSSQVPKPAPRVNTVDHVTGSVLSHNFSDQSSSKPIAEEYEL